MEVVWHGHYVKYLEVARCALLDTIDYNYVQMKASGYAWPVIDMQIRYTGSATFGQRLKLRAEIVEWENRLKIEYLITDAVRGRRLSAAVLRKSPSTAHVARCVLYRRRCCSRNWEFHRYEILVSGGAALCLSLCRHGPPHRWQKFNRCWRSRKSCAAASNKASSWSG